MPQLIIAGATGLVGRSLCKQLSDPNSPITLLIRRSITPLFAHHQVQLTDFQPLQLTQATSDNDAVVCALGTTIKKAGSQAAFADVDLNLVVNLATCAKQAGYQKFIVISSLGTREGSRNFYLQTKAKMESALRELNFNSLVILRPSLLLGDRDEFRFGEKAAEVLSTLVSPLWRGKLARYQPVSADQVATAIRKLATSATDKVTIVESEVIRRIAIE